MTLALAASHPLPAQPFNTAFYATIATIIPVLFLAFAVQGAAFDNLLKHTDRDDLSSGIRIIVGFVILTGGLAGEIEAILSLYYRRPVNNAISVPQAAVALTVAVAARPAAAFGRSAVTWLTGSAPGTAPETASKPSAPEAAGPEPANQPRDPAPS